MARTSYADALKERDLCSKTCMELVAEMRKLIEKLKATRLAMVDQEVNEAEAMLKRIVRGRQR